MPAIESLEITIDSDSCTGCALCMNEAPETFDLDDDGQAILRDAPSDSVEFVLTAAESCPVDAITVKDTESGQMLYPES